MKNHLLLCGFLLLLIGTSCKKETLKINEVYHSKNLKLEFRDYNDGRCPLNANCIWVGEAEVYLHAESNEETASIKLTGIGDDTTLFGHRIELVDLLPYPEAGVEIGEGKKEVKLNVTKL